VYERELPLNLRLMTRIFEILEPLMNHPLNRRVITFFMRYIRLEKVTKFLEGMKLELGG